MFPAAPRLARRSWTGLLLRNMLGPSAVTYCAQRPVGAAAVLCPCWGWFAWAQSEVVKRAARRQRDPSRRQFRQVGRGVEPLE
jgi:hypothetical protein